MLVNESMASQAYYALAKAGIIGLPRTVALRGRAARCPRPFERPYRHQRRVVNLPYLAVHVFVLLTEGSLHLALVWY
jgi:hypothetical protein